MNEMYAEEYRPNKEELEILKEKLLKELVRLIEI